MWLGDADHLHRDHIQPFAFKPADHFAHQAALDTIGLEENQGTFERHHSDSVTVAEVI